MILKVKLLSCIFLLIFILLICSVCVFALPNSDVELAGSINYQKATFNLNVNSNMEDEAVVSGTGEYNYGETITLSVTTSPAFSTFMAWATSTDASNMKILSTNQTYSFLATSDSPREIYALFNKNSSVPSDVTYNGLTYAVYADCGLAKVKGVVSAEIAGNVDIPSYFTENGNSYKVFVIGNSAFENCSNITSVTIPEGVTIIEESAFSGCSSLREIILPEGLTKIDELAFEGTSVTTLHIPSTLESAYNFISSSELETITVANGSVNFITDGYSLISSKGELVLYASANSKTSYTIPSTVKTILKGAFVQCSNLNELNISKDVTTIEENAFIDMVNITSVNIEEGNRNFVVLESEMNLGMFELYKIEDFGISMAPILSNLNGTQSANVVEKDGVYGYGLYLQISGGLEEIFLKYVDPNSGGGIE